MIQGAIFAQKHMVIKDADTHRPLPYATAECFARQWGSYSDSVGRMILPDSIWNNCSLVFSFVGYATKTVNLSPQLQEVFLTKLQHTLGDIVLKPCNKFIEERLEMRSKEKNFSFVYPPETQGILCAVYVPNRTGKKGIIQQISYGVQRGNPKAPVRLRFYTLNTSTGLPANEISGEVITIVPARLGWLSSNISQYHIAVPESGIVVAFEMYDAGPQYRYPEIIHPTDRGTKRILGYGWWIKGMHGDDAIGFSKKPGSLWLKLSPPLNSGLSARSNSAPQVGLRVKFCRE